MDGFEKLVALFLFILLGGAVIDIREAAYRIADATECSEVAP